ncbi:MAG: GNAT family N-acetyltransferase [Bacteroidetes bacterium]|nr:GNAT family N-acetyltransferase [Bacteroidota bacterium]
MTEIKVLTADELHDEAFLQAIALFLFQHLGQYGDPVSHIRKSIDYALSRQKGRGGCLVVSREAEKITGAVVINETGMEDYIPENILVYIAVDEALRGHGLGKKLMQTAIDNTIGNIALHVEPENPAKKLYEKLGFTNKYLEMRLIK